MFLPPCSIITIQMLQMRCFAFLGEPEVRSALRFTGSPVLTGPEGKSSCAQKSLHFLVYIGPRNILLVVFLPTFSSLAFSQPCRAIFLVAVEAVLITNSGSNSTKTSPCWVTCTCTEELAGIVVWFWETTDLHLCCRERRYNITEMIKRCIWSPVRTSSHLQAQKSSFVPLT